MTPNLVDLLAFGAVCALVTVELDLAHRAIASRMRVATRAGAIAASLAADAAALLFGATLVAQASRAAAAAVVVTSVSSVVIALYVAPGIDTWATRLFGLDKNDDPPA